MKVNGWCEGDGGMYEGEGVVCEDEEMVCKGDVMVKGKVCDETVCEEDRMCVKVLGWCVKCRDVE